MGLARKTLIISSFESERIAMANNRQLGIVVVARRWHLQGEEVSFIASAPMVYARLEGIPARTADPRRRHEGVNVRCCR